eukprot:2218603-Pyramimonas_sp.AAC.1
MIGIWEGAMPPSLVRWTPTPDLRNSVGTPMDETGERAGICPRAGDGAETGACTVEEEGTSKGPWSCTDSNSAISGSVTMRETTMRYRSSSRTLQDRRKKSK